MSQRDLILLEDCLVPGTHLTPQQKRLLRLLIGYEGRNLTLKEVVDHIYADREDGGPLNADGVIHSVAFQIRKYLLPEYCIECHLFVNLRHKKPSSSLKEE